MFRFLISELVLIVVAIVVETRDWQLIKTPTVGSIPNAKC